ncbi:MAG: hypothetical protein ABI609_02005 [Acidobacteriota bacterium]
MIPADSELVEYFYGECERAAEIERALASSPELARRYESLRQVMLAVETPEAPPRGEHYEAELWQRLQPAIAGQSRLQAQRSWMWAGMAAAAVLALLLGAFVLGRQQGHEKGREEVMAEGLSKESRDRILLATAIDHLDRAQVLLVSLKNSSADGIPDLDLERSRAAELVVSNRLLRRSAREAGPSVTGALSSVLDDLEPLLLEIAHAPDTLSAADLIVLRERLAERGTLFKLRVMNDRLQRQAPAGRPMRPAQSAPRT